MKLKKLLSLLICLCIIMTSIPFVVAEAESASDLPRDIDGNAWEYSCFARWEDGARTKFDGSNRIIICYPDITGVNFYGSELKDGKYPIVDKDKYGYGFGFRNDNFGNEIMARWININAMEDMWTMEYHSTSSNAHRYTICLSDGVTYLKDNTGSLPSSGGDLTVTTDKSQATAWDLRAVRLNGFFNTFGHDISNADPHFVVNSQGNNRYSLDLSRSQTSYFVVYVEMPWYKTTFCNENGSEFKQDTRQLDGFTIPEGPEKPGYTFLGWTDTQGSTNIVYRAGDTLTPTESRSYYPVYTANRYTVRFFRDSAMSGDYTQQNFTYDRSQALAANPYTSPYFHFLGWQNAADSSKTYDDGEVVKNLTTTANGIVNLYGLWAENTYTVTFSANYGTGSAPPVTVKYSDSFQLPNASSFRRDGHNLAGWNTKPDGSGVGFTPGETVSKLTAVNGGTVALYAIWKQVHTHTPGVWEITISATCTDNGERVKKCTECGAVVETEAIAALGHIEGSFSIINQAASCNGMGEKAWYCERCGALVRTEAVSATGHTRGNYVTVKVPTCSEDGIRQEVCTTCGIVIGEETIPQHTHTAGVWETTIPATCTDNGESVRKCTVCSVVMETEIIDVLGHIEGSFSIINQEASCNGMGEKAWYCERCGSLVRTEAVSPEGHTPGIPVTKFLPTCKTEGIRTISCVNCGIVLEEEKTPAHGHTGGCFATVKSPNCTEDGIKQQACSTCGIVIAEEIIPATGHSGELWVTTIEPTCVRPGEKVLQCTSCGNMLKAEEIAPLGHTSGNMKTCASGATCSICGIPIESADGTSHTWTEWKTYKEAGFFADGQERRFCTTCGDEEFRNIDGSAVGRKYIPAISIAAAILIIGGITLLIVSKKKKGNH